MFVCLSTNVCICVCVCGWVGRFERVCVSEYTACVRVRVSVREEDVCIYNVCVEGWGCM